MLNDTVIRNQISNKRIKWPNSQTLHATQNGEGEPKQREKWERRRRKRRKKKQVSELVTLSFSLITREMTAHYNAVMIAIEAQEEEEVEKIDTVNTTLEEWQSFYGNLWKWDEFIVFSVFTEKQI